MPFDSDAGHDRGAYCAHCGAPMAAKELHFYEMACEPCERQLLNDFLAERGNAT